MLIVKTISKKVSTMSKVYFTLIVFFENGTTVLYNTFWGMLP